MQELRDETEIIICVYAGDLASNKTRQDFGITYDLEVLRIIDMFRKYDLIINSVVVTRYEDQPAVDMFINKLDHRSIKTYKHRFTKGYPTDVETIVSDEGYGANPYIEVSKPLVVVNGPGGLIGFRFLRIRTWNTRLIYRTSLLGSMLTRTAICGSSTI